MVRGGIVALGITAVTIAVLVWLGVHWHDAPGKYFRERKAGTYYSGVLLLAAGAIASRVVGRTDRSPGAGSGLWQRLASCISRSTTF